MIAQSADYVNINGPTYIALKGHIVCRGGGKNYMAGLILLRVKRPRFFFGITVIVLFLFVGLWALEYVDDMDLAKSENQPVGSPQGYISIVIKLSQRRLEVYSDGKVYKRYRIAAGKAANPSPVGEWIISDKSYGDKEMFGTRWMGLDVPWGGYSIHGTDTLWSIGDLTSKGCIRMRNKDVEELYEWISQGTPVTIEGRREKVQRELKVHNVGQDVAILQMKLKELGYLEARADGRFGPDTVKAVRALQEAKGLNPTGLADRQLVKLLGI